MPKLSPPLGCSDSHRGESIVGTAPNEDAYLILEMAKPWPRKIKAEGALAEFRPLLKGGKEEIKLLATPRIDWLPLSERPWALLVRWRDGRAWAQELPAQTEAISAALNGPALGEPLPLYLVCTHGSRDRCCGTAGYPVYKSLSEQGSRKVLQVSHLGGHRYAPVLLALPEWRFFGHLDSQSCLALDRDLSAGAPHPTGYRGHGRLADKLQPIEAQLWADHGDNLLSVQSFSSDSGEPLVRATFRDTSARTYRAKLGIQVQRGYKSCLDIEGSEPQEIKLPTLESLEELDLVSSQPRH